MGRRAHDEREARLYTVEGQLEVFGVCVVRTAQRLDDVMSRIDEDMVRPGTLQALGFIYRQLRALADRCASPRLTDPDEALEMEEDAAEYFEMRLWEIAVTFRSEAKGCSTTLVVPKPLEDLIDVCGELFRIWHWWLAVRSGERDILDGPPPEH